MGGKESTYQRRPVADDGPDGSQDLRAASKDQRRSVDG
jgi:hypothetical protein